MPARHVPARLLVRIVHGLVIASLVSAFVPWHGLAAQSSGAEMCKDGATELVKEAVFTALKNVGGEIIDPIDDLLLDPLIEYVTNPSETAFSAAFGKFIEGTLNQSDKVLKLSFPVYTLVLNGGRIIIGGTQYTVEQMYQAAHEQQIEGIIFGGAAGGMLARFNNPLRDVNFFSIGALANKGITPASFGEKVTSSEQLHTLWFTQYRNVLVKDLLFNAEDVDTKLTEAWPRIEEYWRLKRAAAAIDAFRAELERQARSAATKTPSCAPTPGGSYRGAIDVVDDTALALWEDPSGGIIDPEFYTSLRDVRVEIHLDTTADGTFVTGGSLFFQLTHKATGDLVVYEASQAHGSIAPVEDGYDGFVEFTGTRTESRPGEEPSVDSGLRHSFELAIDGSGQPVLCQSLPLPTLDGVRQYHDCLTRAVVRLQPAQAVPPSA
jgi:hypothetical protein